VVTTEADPAGEVAHRVELADERTAGIRGNGEARNPIEGARGDGVGTRVFLIIPDGEETAEIVAPVAAGPEDVVVFLCECDLLGVRDGVEVDGLESGHILWTGGGIRWVVATVDGTDVVWTPEVAPLDFPGVFGEFAPDEVLGEQVVVFDGVVHAFVRGEERDGELAGFLVGGVGPPIEAAGGDAMDEQMLIQEVLPGVDEVASDGAFASVRFGLPLGLSGVVGFGWYGVG
jgi:hypothetical protein